LRAVTVVTLKNSISEFYDLYGYQDRKKGAEGQLPLFFLPASASNMSIAPMPPLPPQKTIHLNFLYMDTKEYDYCTCRAVSDGVVI